MALIEAWAEERQSIPSGTNITIADDLLQQALDELAVTNIDNMDL